MSAENPTPKVDSTWHGIKRKIRQQFAAGVFALGLGSSPVLPPMHHDANNQDVQKTSQLATSPEAARVTATPTPTPERSEMDVPDAAVSNFKPLPTATPTPEGGPTPTNQQVRMAELGKTIADKTATERIGTCEITVDGNTTSGVVFEIRRRQGEVTIDGTDAVVVFLDEQNNVVEVRTDPSAVSFNLSSLPEKTVAFTVATADGKASIEERSQVPPTGDSSETPQSPVLISTPTDTGRVKTPEAIATPLPPATASQTPEYNPTQEETTESASSAQQTREAEIVAAMQEKVGTRFVGPIELTIDGVVQELPHFEITKDEGTITVSGDSLVQILLLDQEGKVKKIIPVSEGSIDLDISDLARSVGGFAVKTATEGDPVSVNYSNVIPGRAGSQP